MSKREKLKVKNQTGKGDPASFNGGNKKSAKQHSLHQQNEYASATIIDLSIITEPQLLVIFKGLQKRDPTTKEKALESLITFLDDPDSDTDEEVLVIWTQFYSIVASDVSRRQRMLAHKIQGQLFSRFQRQSARYLKDVIGTWIGGIYDNDKVVSRTAVMSFESVFTAPEKQKQVFNTFHSQLLDYVKAALSTKHEYSGSDEKYFSETDIELKISREIARGVLLFSYLLDNVSPESIHELQYEYAAIIVSNVLWRSLTSSDAFLSRACLALVKQLSYNYSAWVQLLVPFLGRYLIANGLYSPPVGNLVEFLDCVVSVTRLYPSSWNAEANSGEPSLHLLLSFAAEGSRLSGPKYWHAIEFLIKSLPRSVLDIDNCSPATLNEVSDAFISGILSEGRLNIDSAVEAYLSVLTYFATGSEVLEVQFAAAKKAEDVLETFILGDGELGKKICTETVARILTSYLRNIIPENEDIAQNFWNKAVSTLLAVISESGDELVPYSEDSPKAVSRWISLSRRIGSLSDEFIASIQFSDTLHEIIQAAVTIIESQAGAEVVPAYGLESIISELFASIKPDNNNLDMLDTFVTSTIPTLILSTSSSQLINIWAAYEIRTGDPAHANKQWNLLVKNILESTSAEKDLNLINLLQASVKVKNGISPNERLEQYASHKADRLFDTSNNERERDWQLILECLVGADVTISMSVCLAILKSLFSASMEDSTSEAIFLKNLVLFSRRNLSVVAAFIKTNEGNQLVSRIWQLAGTSDDTSGSAKAIRQKLESQLNIQQSASGSGNSLFDSLIGALLRDIESNPEVSRESLIDRSVGLWENAIGDVCKVIAPQLLFTRPMWASAITTMFAHPVQQYLTLSNNIGGAMYFIKMKSNDGESGDEDDVKSNAENAAMRLFRMASYTLGVLAKVHLMPFLSRSDQLEIFLMLQQVSELAKDYINAQGDRQLRPLFMSDEGENGNGADDLLAITEMANQLLEARCGVSFTLELLGADTFNPEVPEQSMDGISPDAIFMADFVRLIATQTRESNTRGFYSARVLEILISYLAEDPAFDAKAGDRFFEKHKLRRCKDNLSVTAILVGLSKYSGVMTSTERLRNELASDLLGLKATTMTSQGTSKIIILNGLVHGLEDPTSIPFPRQRAILLLKHLLDVLIKYRAIDFAFRSEATKLLLAILPVVKDLYGEHWNQTLNVILANLTLASEDMENSAVLPMLYYTYKLFALFKSYQYVNEDVADALMEESESSDLLIHILLESSNLPHRSHSGLLCDTALSRHLLEVPLDKFTDPIEILSIISTGSEPLQKTILKIDCKLIPLNQESLAVEAALDTHGVLNIELPGELLSLVVSAPSELEEDNDIDDLYFAGISTPMRAYLYSWKLIFTYFENAPFALKLKYIESLEDGAYTDTLLNLISIVLSLASGKSVDISKFDFSTFDVDTMFDVPLVELRYIAAHLLYQCLRNVPAIVRRWWSQIRNRHLNLTVENFTQKFLSPVLIDAELQSVQQRLADSDTFADDEHMRVKVLRATHQVTAAYTIDEETMEMIVRLPHNFPLHDVQVDGVKRVGVREKQWRAWLLASQHVISSKNGNIIDALTLFQRNVNLHFEGVTECAICYSILHQDRSLPNKKCQTCKNKFHAGCLFKWFQSANSSTCPLCRQPFSYSR
ncbi:uncharacterized protein V1518DRAFT_447605 [Limtongia smithiae]|uniref:uncharacterized protein n=1 Tax=Limtongia smithiae TaxID=1125753 RepID=UPI0034CD1CA6